MDRYGRVCTCCGESELSFLSLDHVLDDGAKDRRRRGSSRGSCFYQQLKNSGFPLGLQVLCHNCQWGKRINKGFCPHHPERDLRIAA